VTVTTWTEIRRQLRIPPGVQGAVVADVDENSNSAEAGLQRGDVIVEINRQPVAMPTMPSNLQARPKATRFFLKIWRRERRSVAGTRYLSVDNTK
jgi:serine protease Do